MKSFTQFALATGLLASAVSAQQQYTIDPMSVDNSTRQFWCQQQQSQCPLICLQTPSNSAETISNDCDWSALTYSCVCSNGISPNISEYSQTLPFFICQEWGNQCVSNCNGNTDCQSSCRDDHPCGALSPTRQNTSTLTQTMSKTASGSGSDSAAQTTGADGQTIYSGFAGGDSASSTGDSGGNGGSSGGSGNGGSSAAFALSAGQTFGTMAVFGVLTLGIAIYL